MQNIGVLIEYKDGQPKTANYGVITASNCDNSDRYALLLEGTAADAKEHLQVYGINKIVEISSQQGSIPWHPELWSDAIIQAMKHFNIKTLLGLSSSQGKDLLPRIAASLDAPLVMDCIAVNPIDKTVKKSQYSGKIIATMKTHGAFHVFGVRPNAIEAALDPCEAECLIYKVRPRGKQLNVKNIISSAIGDIDLSEADVILSGGRGLENSENFNLLRECAEAMGAAVGASRVPVDSGWVPHAMQVGQTGRTVSPKAYIACGISGSVQHFAGMKTAGLIIAINTDPNAAIISKCDYYAVSDLFDIIRALTLMLRGL
jgi:electron transfer flavoprotein alpha subunit